MNVYIDYLQAEISQEIISSKFLNNGLEFYQYFLYNVFESLFKHCIYLVTNKTQRSKTFSLIKILGENL